MNGMLLRQWNGIFIIGVFQLSCFVRKCHRYLLIRNYFTLQAHKYLKLFKCSLYLFYLKDFLLTIYVFYQYYNI